ncbi:hypothetical protein DPMN_001232 [Dreissena polymorpha]|uniref:Reverse transcriptase domain-containing protein n=1 Tax=Dreissena polymorpha TaxID=45954 RepID=A0A9D4MJX4_DREPO|nr:hypothetical protein DPMN_001232 [Dreissena polymorpha]
MVSGVPRRSVLGSILFLVFTNDLPFRVSTKIRLFADDCVINRHKYTLIATVNIYRKTSIGCGNGRGSDEWLSTLRNVASCDYVEDDYCTTTHSIGIHSLDKKKQSTYGWN